MLFLNIYSAGLILIFKCLTTLAVEQDFTLLNRLNTVLGATMNTLGAPFTPKPINEDVTFWCKTPNNLQYVQLFMNDAAVNAKLVVTKPIAFVVHGWTDNYERTWMQDLTSTYVSTQDANICSVDWSRLALREYALAASKTDEVGNYLGAVIQNLIDQGIYTVDNVTLIGHSMGAHIVGYAGAFLKGQVPRIYGLDPAGPAFTKLPRLEPPSRRLDPTDGKFVQAIHTDRFLIGTSVHLGHQDIFPNGGATPQPGCLNPFTSYTFVSMTCSHYKAVLIFIEALVKEIIATECDSTVGYVGYTMGLACRRNPTDFVGPRSRNTASGEMVCRTK